jgi:predicted Ser/Thr protein kinase
VDDPGPETDADRRLGADLRAMRPEADVVAAAAQVRVVAALFGAQAAAPVRIGRYELAERAGEGGGGVVYAAWDPELSRKVAIKLVRSDGQRDRVLAEGQALAKLSHPNVVPLHDVGTIDDRVYLVMELVDGQTLRGYVAKTPRTAADVLGVYRQAGAGLAAAHAAGIVHRDFKPDNALVGADGRVRVVDFGLARGGAEPVAAGSSPGPSGPSTSTGSVHTRAGIGTPRYMAPEQVAGDPLSAATDQYAFCASLREALAARRGPDGAKAGKPPRWVEPILARGTAHQPDARYPSMHALLAALARDPAWRWRRRGLAIGALVAAGAIVAAFVIGRSRSRGPACDGGPAELADVWSPAIRGKVSSHLASLATAYAASAAPTLVATFDTYGATWAAGHRAACEAHRSGAQSAALLDQRMACLARAKAAFGAAVELGASSGTDQLVAAISATGALPSLARCGDVELLVDRGATPPSAQAVAVAELDAELARLEIEIQATEPTARERAVAAVTRAETLGFPPLVARAYRVRGLAEMRANDRVNATATLHRAGTAAIAAGDTLLAVDALARELYTRGTTVDPPGALADAPLYQALAARLPTTAHAERALLSANIGSVHMAANERALAGPAFRTAAAEIEAIAGERSLELVQMHSNLALVTEDDGERRNIYRETVAQLTAKVGPDHPYTLEQAVFLAVADPDSAAALAQTRAICDRTVALHPGAGAQLDRCWSEVGWLAHETGDHALAATAYGHVVALERKGAHKARLALARGWSELLAERYRDAVTVLAAYADEERGPDMSWFTRGYVGEADLARGLALRALGDRGWRDAVTAGRDGLAAAVAAQPTPKWKRRLAYAEAQLTAR